MGWRFCVAGVFAALLPVFAHAQTVHIAKQFGISYLPLIVMQEDAMLEAEGKAAGLDLHPQYVTISNGTAINDGLISGSLDIASGGVGPMLVIWGKTRSNLGVKALAALNSMPIWLNTRNPAVKTVADFTDADRIALPAVKVSVQALVLQMAAAKAFGDAGFAKLDTLTVSLGHPDGYAAMMGFHGEIDSHFTSAPFQYQELQDPRVHRVLDSYEVLGGPHTFNVVWTTTKYHDANPRIMTAFLAALDRAEKLIATDPAHAAELYVRNEKSNMPAAEIAAMIARPENRWTTVPERVMPFAAFMHKTGALAAMPADWKQMFFADIGDKPGS
jgi:NitT/TauT family transport system substrate-binding protein